MTIQELRLDEETWQRAHHMRRVEWRALVDDLVSHAQLGPRFDGSYLLITPDPATIVIEFLDDEGAVRETLQIALALLEPHVKEYLAIIRRLDEGAGHREASWVEAVDMAKKVVHDSAAKTLATAIPELSSDHETYRRLFTLLLALVIDTTKLAHAHGHRR
jgi:uncharacterized protein (UPF0262 family)